MKIYLVRHTETFGNLENRFNGITESDYTEKGLAVKEKVIDYFKKLNTRESFDTIYTSPISRARKIADDIGVFLDLKPKIVEDLKEFNFGIFEGLKISEAQELYPDEFNNWMQDYINVEISGGDSFVKKSKVLHKWLKIVSNLNNSSIIIITHGAVIRSLLAYFLDLDLEDSWHFDIPLGGICEIEFKNDYGILKQLIDIENL